MRESNHDRLTRIERLLEALAAQTAEVHRLAVLTAVAPMPQAAPPKPVKPRVRKKR